MRPVPCNACEGAGVEYAQGFLVSPVFVTDPSPSFTTGPVSLTLTNNGPRDLLVDASAMLGSIITAVGSVSIASILRMQVDAGGFVTVCEWQGDLDGTISTDPAFGGDGTVLPGGTNAVHTQGSSMAFRELSGGPFLSLPILGPGDSTTIDFELLLTVLGSWSTSLAFQFGTVQLLGVPLP